MPRQPIHRQYTPQETAAIAGVRLQRVQNALTDGRFVGSRRCDADGRRRIDLPAVLAFAAADRLGKVRIAPQTLYRAFHDAGLPHGPLRVTDTVTIDAQALLGPVLRNIALYEEARTCIVSDPSVMGGEPVVKGTRLTARMLHARIRGGDPIETILQDYPYLTAASIEAAVLFTEANPPRGRPRRRVSGPNA